MSEADLKNVNLMELTPVRVADWIEDGGRITLLRPRYPASGLKGLLKRISWSMSASRIRLDAIGSAAWLRMDGSATVGRIAGELREEFGEEAEPSEERVGTFVRQLRKEGLLGYPGWDHSLLLRQGRRVEPTDSPSKASM